MKKMCVLSIGASMLMLMTMGFSMESKADSTDMGSITKSGNCVRELHGNFSGELHEGMANKVLNLGKYEEFTDIPFNVTLDVIDGGPTSLNWSASVYDVNKGQMISDWKSFNHNYSILSLDYTEKPSDGDKLELFVHANSGSGTIAIRW